MVAHLNYTDTAVVSAAYSAAE